MTTPDPRAVADLLHNARRLIVADGHCPTDDFGSPHAGWTLEAAVFAAAGLLQQVGHRWDLVINLESPAFITSWATCNAAFSAVTAALGARVSADVAWRHVSEADTRLTAVEAARLLWNAAAYALRDARVAA
jgi:hypothetical protein